MKKKTKILITAASVLAILGGWVLYSSISVAAPNIWKKPISIKNYLLHSGRVTFTFPAVLKIVEGKFVDEGKKEKAGKIDTEENSILFGRIKYGKYYFHITLSNGTETSNVEFCTYHAPNWSRERFEITKLNPLEYNAYSDGEPWDAEILEIIKIEPIK